MNNIYSVDIQYKGIIFDKRGCNKIYFGNMLSFISSLGFYNLFSSILLKDNIKFKLKSNNMLVYLSNNALCLEIFLLHMRNFLNVLHLYNFLLNNFFTKFVHVLSVGLGFRKRKRYRRGRRFFELYMGNRHRVSFELPKNFYMILIRRGNIILFSNSKNKLWYPLVCFRNFRKELAFKLKGFFIRRKRASKKLMRIWAFARRVKFKEASTKLSKKQKTV